MILEEYYTSSMAYTLEDKDTEKNCSSWWNTRLKLDRWLADLLRDMEDRWFGLWKHLLLGECLENKHLESVQKKLMNNLKSACKVDDVHEIESIIKLITGCGCGVGHEEEWLSELILKKGCYVGGMAYSSKQDKINNLSKLISDAIHEIMHVDRGPVILVPDFDIQMLPWENLPVLRNQEVYRMPCVANISSTFERYQKKVGKGSNIVFPMIDPLDAYYLINPDGDLPYTEAAFKNWFEHQNLEGMSGTSPTMDELSVALKDHDLFMYFVHGSGVQYIAGDEIEKLDGCAGTLLMGCRSGSLTLNGSSYIPKGAPLYYLSVGSPVIVANLWEVTDIDINRFGKALLHAWITTRSSCSANSHKSNVDGEKRKTSRKKPIESCEVNTCINNRSRIGSFMGQARQACTLPFLIIASPVCYGVPTCIRKKDL